MIVSGRTNRTPSGYSEDTLVQQTEVDPIVKTVFRIPASEFRENSVRIPQNSGDTEFRTEFRGHNTISKKQYVSPDLLI